MPRRASQGRLSTSAPPPPFPWVALTLRAASKEGVFLFLPLCQLCSHQSLAARAGNGDRLSLSAPQLHQGRRKPGIRGALTHCPFGRGERRAGLVLLCPWSRWYFSGTLGGEEFTASPYSVIKEGNLGNRELGRIFTVNT